MGFHHQHARVLIDLFGGEAQLGNVLTIGRQFLFATPDDVARVLRRRGLSRPDEPGRFEEFRSADNSYAEPFLRFLGAKSVESLDASDYEQATLIHDLNLPIPLDWHERYDTVIDGGTLEHVFNFPVAIRSLMEMTRVGGRLILFGPANSQCGHGFYQFSPEVFFTALVEANGYSLEKMLLIENYESGAVFEVASPRLVNTRVTCTSREELEYAAVARRISRLPVFAAAPQQPSYETIWAGRRNSYTHHSPRSLRQRLLRLAGRFSPKILRFYYTHRTRPGSQPRFFRRVDI